MLSDNALFRLGLSLLRIKLLRSNSLFLRCYFARLSGISVKALSVNRQGRCIVAFCLLVPDGCNELHCWIFDYLIHTSDTNI